MVILSIIKWMVSVFYSYKMVKDIKGNGLIIKNMVMDSINGPTVVYIKAVIIREKETDRVKWYIKMVNNTKAIG